MIAALKTYPGNLSQPRHSHDTMSVTLVLVGALRERVGGTEEVARPLSLVLKPVAVEHETRFDTPCRTIQILLDATEADELARVQPAAREWRWVHQGPFVRPFLELALTLGTADPAMAELAILDTLAAIGRLPLGRGRFPSVIGKVQEQLEDPDVPPIAQLSREAGFHPVYLARLFRRTVGMTMSRYARRSRVRRVVGLLERGHSLSAIAHETGFADHSHMCRTFRAETGVTPSQYRRLCA